MQTRVKQRVSGKAVSCNKSLVKVSKTFLRKQVSGYKHVKHIFSTKFQVAIFRSDMEKGADTWTLSAAVFENCGNFLNLGDYAPLFSE